MAKKNKKTIEKIESKEAERECPHCHVISDNFKMTNAYPFSVRYICGICEHPYIIMNSK